MTTNQHQPTASERALRTVLATGAIVFGGSAVFLLALPELFLSLLALPTDVGQQWSMRMIGITLVALSGNMLSIVRTGALTTLRLGARVMQFSAFALGALTLLIPVALSWFTIVYACVGFGFSAAYTIAFARKDR